MRRTLELLSGKWRLYVLYVLSKASVCRFGALKRAIPGITSTMLTHALRDLETLGIVHREQFNEVPPHVEYSLTEKGLKTVAGVHRTGQVGRDLLGPPDHPCRRGQHAPKQQSLAGFGNLHQRMCGTQQEGWRFPGGSQEAPVRRYASKIPPFCEEVFWILCPNCKPWHSRRESANFDRGGGFAVGRWSRFGPAQVGTCGVVLPARSGGDPGFSRESPDARSRGIPPPPLLWPARCSLARFGVGSAAERWRAITVPMHVP